MKKTIIIQVYDPKCTEAPFEMIEIERFDVDDFPESSDDLSHSEYNYLIKLCYDKGYSFRFYNLDLENPNAFCVTVHNAGSSGSEHYIFDILNRKHQHFK